MSLITQLICDNCGKEILKESGTFSIGNRLAPEGVKNVEFKIGAGRLFCTYYIYQEPQIYIPQDWCRECMLELLNTGVETMDYA